MKIPSCVLNGLFATEVSGGARLYNTYLADPDKNMLHRGKRQRTKKTRSLWESHGGLFPLWRDAGRAPGRLHRRPADSSVHWRGTSHLTSSMLSSPLPGSTFSLSLWETGVSVRRTAHEKSHIQLLFPCRTCDGLVTAIVTRHIGVKDQMGEDFTAWIRWKKMKQLE